MGAPSPDNDRDEGLLLIRLVERRERIEANEVAARRATGGNGADVKRNAEFNVLCECGREDCSVTLPISARQYAGVRRGRREAIVAPGHQLPPDQLQRVSDSYWVVRQHVEPR